MTSDDERREVAERLRRSWPSIADESPVNRALRFYLAVNSAIFDPRECDEKDTIDMLDRLADLIDPGDMSQSCRDTVACESGQNQDTNQDTVPKEFPAVQKAPECDREALLALADKMGKYARRRNRHDMDVDTMAVSAWILRIREACGEAAS